MQLLKKLQAVTAPVNTVINHERKVALIHKVKEVIAQEEARADEAFLALGKYYYQYLRDAENEETAFYCEEIDHAQRRLQRAELKLQELLRTKDPFAKEKKCEDEFLFDASECFTCGSGCDGCTGCDDWVEEALNEEFTLETAEPGMDVELPPQVQKAMEEEPAKDGAAPAQESVGEDTKTDAG